LLLLLLLLLNNNNHDLTALVRKVVCKYTSLHYQIDSYKNTGGTPGNSLSHTRQSNAQSSNTVTLVRTYPVLHFSVFNFWI